MNKKKISNIAPPIGPSLAGLLAELRNIGLRYTWNLLDSKVICKAKFESIGVEQLQQERSKYKTTIRTGVLRLNHHEIMKNFHLAEKFLAGYRALERGGILSLLEYFGRENDILLQNYRKLTAFLHKLQKCAYNTPHPKFRTLENFLRELF